VVELDDERQLVGVTAGDRAEHADRRGHRVAAALDGELDEVLGIEVHRVGREGRAGGVLDALVDGEDRDVARAREAPGVRQPVEPAERLRVAVGVDPQAVDEVGAGQVELL